MSLGFFLMSLVQMLERDFDRLELCYKHTNISPIGIAEGSGSDFPLNLRRTAELSGFDEVFGNACDMWEAYDCRAEAFSVLGMIGDVLARVGTHLIVWCSYEFRMCELADRYCGTSSIMSQKKNPMGAIQLVNAGIAARHMSLLDEGGRVGAGGGDDRYFEQAVRHIINGLRYARGILETATFYTVRMRELCRYGFMCNADLCRVIVQERGLPWRTAHQITALMARKAKERGWEMDDVSSEFLDECSMEYINYGKPLNLGEELIRTAFNPENSLRNLRTHGGTAPERVKEQIEFGENRLCIDIEKVDDKRRRLKVAAEKLEKAIDSLIDEV
jgi:argininosuccinate lyase